MFCFVLVGGKGEQPKKLNTDFRIRSVTATAGSDVT